MALWIQASGAISLNSSAVGNLRNGLVAALGFSEATGTTSADKSGRGGTATVTATLPWVYGKHGFAMLFDGNHGINLPHVAAHSIAKNLTIMAWVYPTVDPGTGEHNAVVNNSGSDGCYWLEAWDYNDGTGQPNFGILLSGGGGYWVAMGPTNLPVNTWTHMAGTYDGSTLIYYQNGVQKATLSKPGSIDVTCAANISVGNASSWGEPFTGKVDDVRVYARTLSAAQIASIANQGVSDADFGNCQFFLTSGTSWTVPSDWNNANNRIEVIGAGGGGSSNGSSTGGGGGGGGGYSLATNTTLTPSSSVSYAVGTGGGAGVAGGDTYFCKANTSCGSATAANVVAGAYGGSGASAASGGAGGAVATGSGNSGGAGATVASTTGGGGGGAAGFFGGGGNGSTSKTGGSADGSSGPTGTTSAGTTGKEWDGTHGSGSGGGGGAASGTGKAGGSYGGGGGGAGTSSTPGSGGNGIIVITYQGTTCS